MKLNEIPYKIYFTILSVSLLVCSAAYQQAYWEWVNISFMEYMDFGDLIYKSITGIVPVVVIATEFIMVFLLMDKIPLIKRWNDKNNIIKAQQYEKHILRKVIPRDIYNSLITNGFMFIGMIGMSVFSQELSFSILAVFPFMAWIAYIVLREKIAGIAEDNLNAVLFFMGILPFACYIIGLSDIKRVLENANVNKAVTSEIIVSDKQFPDTKGYMIMGHMGGFYFLHSKEYRDMYIVPEGSVIERRYMLADVPKDVPGNTGDVPADAIIMPDVPTISSN